MPELSRFFGIIVRMFAEVGGQHHVAHFHAYWQDQVAVVSIDPIDVIAGSLPTRQRRLVEAGRSCTNRNCARTGTDCRTVSLRCRSNL